MVTIDFYKGILDELFDAVYFVDLDGRITYWNRAAENISGFKADEVIGRKCSDNLLVHVDDEGRKLCLGLCPLKKSMADGVSRTGDVYMRHKEGFRVPVAVRVAPMKDAQGNTIGAIELFNDNSPKIAAMQKIKELENLVFTDQLTGAANRKYLENFILSRFEEMHRYNWPFGVMFLDIDHFKSVNDTYGHEMGDRVLRMVSQTLIKNGRTFDLLGRWGGEEFVYVLVNVNRERSFEIADRFRNLIANSMIFLDNSAISVTVSIGVAVADKEDTIESIIRRADQLMYQSKTGGRNRVTLDAAGS